MSGAFYKTADLKPHQSRYWLNADFKGEAKFRQQVITVCEVDQAAPARLRNEGIHTGWVDEKTGIQALGSAPTKSMRPGHIEKQEFEYVRQGTPTLIRNFEVATGQ